MTRHWIFGCAVALVLVVQLTGGCRQAAIAEVRTFVASYQSHAESTPARIRLKNVDDYLQGIADEIRNASSQVNTELVAQGISQGKRTPKVELDVHDKFDVYLVHSVAPNAATPGDNCAQVTSRLFLEMERPEQLYAVLAHEFGHIHELHQVDQVERRKTTEVTVAIVAGVGAGLDAYAAGSNPYHQKQDWGQVTRNAMNAYVPGRKEDEFEADLVGFDLYQSMRLDPNGYISLFELLQSRWGDSDSPSHPRNSERIDRLRKVAAVKPQEGSVRRLDSRQFTEMQRRVANELERLERQGFLVSEEIVLAQRAASGALTSRVCACGPMNLDWSQQSVMFDAVIQLRQSGK